MHFTKLRRYIAVLDLRLCGNNSNAQQEYRAIKIVPLDTVVDAVEIDPMSKSKKHCLQVITEGKSFRFSAPSEEALAKWLGAMKSTLAKRALAKAAPTGVVGVTGSAATMSSPGHPPVPVASPQL